MNPIKCQQCGPVIWLHLTLVLVLTLAPALSTLPYGPMCRTIVGGSPPSFAFLMDEILMRWRLAMFDLNRK